MKVPKFNPRIEGKDNNISLKDQQLEADAFKKVLKEGAEKGSPIQNWVNIEYTKLDQNKRLLKAVQEKVNSYNDPEFQRIFTREEKIFIRTLKKLENLLESFVSVTQRILNNSHIKHSGNTFSILPKRQEDVGENNLPISQAVFKALYASKDDYIEEIKNTINELMKIDPEDMKFIFEIEHYGLVDQDGLKTKTRDN